MAYRSRALASTAIRRMERQRRDALLFELDVHALDTARQAFARGLSLGDLEDLAYARRIRRAALATDDWS